MKRIILFLSILSLLLNMGCGIVGKNDEGAIIYEILFDEQEKKENPVIGLLPTEMTLYFKDNSSKSMIEGFMGMFVTAYISDCDTKKNSILFKVMTDKHYCQTDFGVQTLGFDPLPGVQLNDTGEEAELLGMKAYKVNVTSADSSIQPYDLYYTNDIKVLNPNWNNPYKEIGGVLLDFKLKMKGITMHLKAKELKNEELPEDVFLVPDGYTEVSPEKLNTIIDEIMKSAN